MAEQTITITITITETVVHQKQFTLAEVEEAAGMTGPMSIVRPSPG